MNLKTDARHIPPYEARVKILIVKNLFTNYRHKTGTSVVIFSLYFRQQASVIKKPDFKNSSQ